MHFIERLDDQSLRSLDRSIDIVITVDVVFLQVVAAVIFFSSAWKYPRLVSVFDTLERNIKNFGNLRCCNNVNPQFLPNVSYEPQYNEQAFSLAISIVNMILLYCSQAALPVNFTHMAQSIAKSFEKVNVKIEMEITSPGNIDGTDTRTDGRYLLVISHITTTSYYFFLLLKTGKAFSTANDGAWILLHICYVALLLNSSTDVTNKANETGQTICKLINNDRPGT
ncbi:hypothetical protein J6590_105978 [Homalodisca vitripennis]|nr:hypothetical protein J6590_105978 [Homalodisca vitripennis]